MSLSHCSFNWGHPTEDLPILKDINWRVDKGSLVAVVGSVGSGKSSLVSSLLGEMTKIEGEARVNGRIAYVPQQAWMQNATVRNNILFGKPYKQRLYDKVKAKF